MNHITIKSLRANDIVAVEMYDTDTDGISGLNVSKSDLGRWLAQCQPCRVHLRVKDQSLQRLVYDVGRSSPAISMGGNN